jgi:hypothetical protein
LWGKIIFKHILVNASSNGVSAKEKKDPATRSQISPHQTFSFAESRMYSWISFGSVNFKIGNYAN